MKFLLKRELKDNRTEMPGTSVIDSVDEFFNRVNDEKFTRVINKAAELIVHSELIVFFGVSTSGYFAQYGARILANLGLFTLVITDPFQPRPDKIIDPEHVLLVDLSVSGETEQGLRLAQIYHEKKAKVLSITNSSLSTLAKISDVNISYNVHEVVGDNFINLTTQVPLVFILELIMNKSQSLLTDIRN
ncbi:MAG: SIS domain-containing protein [Sporolactobacillus sp.]|nr:SIS domain-containing protein [Sporolactobacillus sp.]